TLAASDAASNATAVGGTSLHAGKASSASIISSILRTRPSHRWCNLALSRAWAARDFSITTEAGGWLAMGSLDLSNFAKACMESARFVRPEIGAAVDVVVFEDDDGYTVKVRAWLPRSSKLQSAEELVPKSEASAVEAHAVVRRLEQELI